HRRMAELHARCEMPVRDPSIRYPYPGTSQSSRDPAPMIHHGPPFQCLIDARLGERGGRARIAIPSMPILFLDGCLQAVGLFARILFGKVALPRAFVRVLLPSAI